MKHPGYEQWMEYLYGELDARGEAELSEHLAACPACQAEVARWRTVMEELDTWQLPGKRARAPAVWRLVRWAAAAVLLIGLGLGMGRLWAPDEAALRESVETSVKQDLHEELTAQLRASSQALETRLQEDLLQRLDRGLRVVANETLAASNVTTAELLGEFARALEAARAQDHQALGLVLRTLESRRLADDVLLHRGLETLATVTEDEFLRTREDMVRLAVYGASGGGAQVVPAEPEGINEGRGQ